LADITEAIKLVITVADQNMATAIIRALRKALALAAAIHAPNAAPSMLRQHASVSNAAHRCRLKYVLVVVQNCHQVRNFAANAANLSSNAQLLEHSIFDGPHPDWLTLCKMLTNNIQGYTWLRHQDVAVTKVTKTRAV